MSEIVRTVLPQQPTGLADRPRLHHSRELDVLVGEMVERRHIFWSRTALLDHAPLVQEDGQWMLVHLPAYSTSVADAMRLARRLAERGWRFSVEFGPIERGRDDEQATCRIKPPSQPPHEQSASTLPMAVCLAAVSVAWFLDDISGARRWEGRLREMRAWGEPWTSWLP
jgi:hypothetical protein